MAAEKAAAQIRVYYAFRMVAIIAQGRGVQTYFACKLAVAAEIFTERTGRSIYSTYPASHIYVVVNLQFDILQYCILFLQIFFYINFCVVYIFEMHQSKVCFTK